MLQFVPSPPFGWFCFAGSHSRSRHFLFTCIWTSSPSTLLLPDYGFISPVCPVFFISGWWSVGLLIFSSASVQWVLRCHIVCSYFVCDFAPHGVSGPFKLLLCFPCLLVFVVYISFPYLVGPHESPVNNN